MIVLSVGYDLYQSSLGSDHGKDVSDELRWLMYPDVLIRFYRSFRRFVRVEITGTTVDFDLPPVSPG
jgi:hypothetical protein